MSKLAPYRNPKDFTKNEQCARCGGCCSSLLPVSRQELKDMRAAADASGFVPTLPENDNVLYLHCPFLVSAEDDTRACAIYDSRPAICRHFCCNLTKEQMMNLPENTEIILENVRNVWSAYNRTGLKLNGKEVLYDNAPAAKITDISGNRFRFQVGKPISIELTSGRILPSSLIINVYQDGIQVFDAEREKVSIVKYKNMKDILTPDAKLPPSRTEKPKPNRARRRQAEKEAKRNRP